MLTVWVEQIDSLIFLSELQGTFAVWKHVEKIEFSLSLSYRETERAALPVNVFLHDYALFSTPLIPIFVFRTMQHKMYFIFCSSKLYLNTTDKLNALSLIYWKCSSVLLTELPVIIYYHLCFQKIFWIRSGIISEDCSEALKCCSPYRQ